jgi:hypothetical protein
MTIFGTRPYWLKYETQDLSKVPFWKLYIAALARPMLIDDEDFGDAEYGEKGRISRIYNLGLRLRYRKVENPAYDKPVYYIFDYVDCPEYDERTNTPYLDVREGYKLYGIRDEYFSKGEVFYEDRVIYAKSETNALKLREEEWENEEWRDRLLPNRAFVFPMFYSEVVSYEFEKVSGKLQLKQTHKRKNIDNY